MQQVAIRCASRFEWALGRGSIRAFEQFGNALSFLSVEKLISGMPIEGIADMFNALAPFVLGSHMLIAVASGPPSIDMQRMCRASATAMVSISGDSTNDYQSCLSDEQAARDQIAKDWATFPARDKSFCALSTEYLPSYVEWLTCFEMERDVRKIRTEQPDEQSPSVPAGAKAARHSHHGATKNAD